MKRVLESTKKFNRELRKSISTAIVAAFGLLIALSWKDVITEVMSKITSHSPVQGLLINALIVTIVSVLIIMIVTKFTPDD